MWGNFYQKVPPFSVSRKNTLFRGKKSDVEGIKGSYWIRNDVCGTDNIGDPVSDAVWERNKNVAERLNITSTLSWKRC